MLSRKLIPWKGRRFRAVKAQAGRACHGYSCLGCVAYEPQQGPEPRPKCSELPMCVPLGRRDRQDVVYKEVIAKKKEKKS